MYKDSYWGGWGGHRTRRGDMAPIILRALSEKPMHGYEIISYLEDKSHGFWRPSAGSIYPNLQLLEEQELVVSETKNGKKVYSLTKKGEAKAAESEERYHDHWQERATHAKQFKNLKLGFVEIIGLLRQIAALDKEAKTAAAQKILDKTKTELAKLLADTGKA